MRKKLHKTLSNFPQKDFFEKLLMFSTRYDTVAYFASHHAPENFQYLVALGKKKEIQNPRRAFSGLRDFASGNNEDWMFGMLSYDLKNQVEDLSSENSDKLKFPLLQFFVPELVVYAEPGASEDGVTFEYPDERFDREDVEQLFEHIKAHELSVPFQQEIRLRASSTPEQYFRSVNDLKKHIQYGNIYEVNYCQQYYSENTVIQPEQTFLQLIDKTKAPFSAFYKTGGCYLLSASPERYLMKKGNRLISQPMKGTSKRGDTPLEDARLKAALYKDSKERAENVMITDLVRNDLSRVAVKNSVRVDELFGVYTFETVHQMISTVSALVDENISWVDIIESTFPMGSMTGAPKVKAMELIEFTENFKRGLYSGSVGYVSPEGDFDFNVIIRSVLYNSNLRTLAIMAGGAITSGSDVEKEYRESLLKLEALAEVLNAKL